MHFAPYALCVTSVWAAVQSLSPALQSEVRSLASQAPTGYAPKRTPCPAEPIIREAQGILKDEKAYINRRHAIANEALASWLNKTSPKFKFCDDDLPVLAFSSSGGGERATLVTAGVHTAFDERSGNSSVAGLWQALTYESALSGGAIFLIDWAFHNWKPVPQLIHHFWRRSLNNGLVFPRSHGTTNDSATKAQIYGEIYQKALAGFPVSFVDLLGRYEAYSFLRPGGAAASRFGSLIQQPLAQQFRAPFPVIVAGGVNAYGNDCPVPSLADPQYEFTPFEFGSWDKGISAFVNLTYLGSQPLVNTTSCVTGYDSTGFVIASSGDAFGLDCAEINAERPKFLKDYGIPQGLVELSSSTNVSLSAQYPNPFYQSGKSAAVNNYETLNLVDGGLSNTDVAIWPLLYRKVDVLFVSDNSADANQNYTNGTDMYSTYERAKLYNLTRMPPVPDPATFLKHGFEKRNIFYGCHCMDQMTIIYMPNREIVYPSNYTATPEPMPDSVLYGLLENGAAIGTNGEADDWAQCVACAILEKHNTTLPEFCGACFNKYCAVWK